MKAGKIGLLAGIVMIFAAHLGKAATMVLPAGNITPSGVTYTNVNGIAGFDVRVSYSGNFDPGRPTVTPVAGINNASLAPIGDRPMTSFDSNTITFEFLQGGSPLLVSDVVIRSVNAMFGTSELEEGLRVSSTAAVSYDATVLTGVVGASDVVTDGLIAEIRNLNIDGGPRFDEVTFEAASAVSDVSVDYVFKKVAENATSGWAQTQTFTVEFTEPDAVPEPARALLAMVGAIGVLTRRRRWGTD